MGQLFGTDGVRGVANKKITGELAFKLGRAGGYQLTKDLSGEDKPVMLIGKDTRISGDMLEAALAAGMASVGVDVIKLGVIPTPGVAYLTSRMNAAGGVMISASHNPIADNGIKFFDKEGYKLTDEMEDSVEQFILNNYDNLPYPTHTGIGKIKSDISLVNQYIEYLVSTAERNLEGLKIVLDCANGASYHVAPQVLKKLGAELILINCLPEGEKINVNSGSTHPEILQEEVTVHGADVGIAHDGDADRVIMVDEKGNLVDGDKIMAICALDMLQRRELKGNTLVTTRYSNLGLKEVVEENGGNLSITKNGDRYVLREMLKNNYNLGGEKSGHIIFLDYNNTGDGVLTAVQLLQVIVRKGKSLSKLAEVMKEWPQKLNSVRVKHKDRWQDNEEIQKMIKKAEKEIGKQGRVFVRASGTEPVIRVMLEGKEENLLSKWEKKLADVIAEELN